ncbi:hypothetical protein OIDMADRAFT_27327 [Oidiodendron maius Zn]|uniref:Uncharacterized protein n=1 Tax=Oidiodendron maius (strain Zn) TaxID=913774 RepID=A0A0C3DLC8_OIDMZ|nr:hypothetical protein OIDMADRAFT_27327 [Oidiodendron maius Zn]
MHAKLFLASLCLISTAWSAPQLDKIETKLNARVPFDHPTVVKRGNDYFKRESGCILSFNSRMMQRLANIDSLLQPMAHYALAFSNASVVLTREEGPITFVELIVPFVNPSARRQ